MFLTKAILSLSTVIALRIPDRNVLPAHHMHCLDQSSVGGGSALQSAALFIHSLRLLLVQAQACHLCNDSRLLLVKARRQAKLLYFFLLCKLPISSGLCIIRPKWHFVALKYILLCELPISSLCIVRLK